MQQKSRSSKSKIMGRRNSMGRRRNSLSGGAPLEPIYENERSPSTKRTSFGEGSEFQIVMANANTHSEFVTSTHRRMLSSPTKAQQLQGEGRWGNGDFNIGKDSDSSINTASTSSLTAFPYDPEEEYEDFFEEGAKDNNKMTSTEIIEHATDVVAGKYDYNNNNNNTAGTSSSSRRRQLRRSSLPNIPIRQESFEKAPSSPSQQHQLSESSSAVAVDKFGIPIASSSSHTRRKPRERRSSMPSRRGSDPTSKSEPGYSDTIAAQIDKFGIPISQIGTTGRRRQGRRSSIGDSPSKQAEPQALVDKYGIPIAPSLESTSNHSACRSPTTRSPTTRSPTTRSPTTRSRRRLRRSSIGNSPSKSGTKALLGNYGIPVAPSLESGSNHSASQSHRRHLRRSSMGDSPKKTEPQALVDKYGVPIAPSLESNLNNSSRSRRRHMRRSSMGDYPKKTEPQALVDKYGVPIAPSLGSSSNHSTNRSRRRHLRRSSMGDYPKKPEPQAPVDKYGVPIAPSLGSSSNYSTNRSRRRNSRRSSMGDYPKKPEKQAPVDKFGIPIAPSLGPSSNYSTNRSRRRHLGGSSMGDSPKKTVEGPPLVDKFGIPIAPSLDSGSNHCSRMIDKKQSRRSSMPTSMSTDTDWQLTGSSSSMDHNKPSLEARSSTHGSRNQGRRSSNPTRRAPRRSVSFDLSSDEEMKVDSFPLYGSVTVDKSGIPVWPKELTSNNNRRRKQERRSSMPTTPTSEQETYNAKQNSLRRERRPSMPIEQSSFANTSAQRFFSEDGNKPRSLSPGNNAPIRPKRVPSMENFGGEKAKANYQVAQPNAKFEIVKPPKKSINNSNKLESIQCRPPTDSKSSNTKESLDLVLGNSRWGDGKRGAKTHTSDLDCDISVNSMNQKEGEWWW